MTDEEFHKYDKYVELAMNARSNTGVASSESAEASVGSAEASVGSAEAPSGSGGVPTDSIEAPAGIRSRRSRVSDAIHEAIEDFKS